MPKLFVIVATLLLGATLQVFAEPSVVVLRTEHVGYREIDGTIAGRLLRELGRQALLVAARDELGAATRDETLGELEHLGDLEPAVDWTPRVRSRWEGVTEVLLEETSDGAPVGEPITAKDGTQDSVTLYPALAAAWEEASRAALKERLQEAGVEGEAPELNPENQPDEEVEELLGRMNFVTQWEAVSRAHRAIADAGPSVEWLAVLARGYAHLGTLTDHHWTGAPEAFYARAMIYAERARTYGSKGSGAEWLRPYVLAMCGAHAAALSELEHLQPYETEPPAWAQLIEPIGHFDLEGLNRVGRANRSVKPLALWSAVCLRRTLGSHASFHDVAMESLKSDPDAYGAYSNLVTVYPSLGDQRYGAAVGPMSLGKFVLERLGEVHDLPESFREKLPKNDGELRELVVELKDSYEGDPFLPTPNYAIEQLRAADAESLREPSWESLASLIAEEQFVMAASYCTSMQNATESNLKEPVDALMQLVHGHRFAPYIQACALSSAATRDQRAEALGDLVIVDPRHNMRPMMWFAMRLPKPEDGSLNLGYDASWEALWSFDYRLPSLAEEYITGAGLWWSRLDDRNRRWITDNYKAVSPEAPQWLRSEMYQTSHPTPETLEAWAETAKKDYATARNMAGYYEDAGRIEEAAEWLEDSYELEPQADTAIQLAKLYRSQGKEDLWLPTLRRYLDEEENRGLEHSRVQIYIAQTLMREDLDFAAALPYAEEAAQTYSARSLAIALEANEGMARWEEADHYAQALSSSYPSSSGDAWYLFRRRTGHGDPEEAKPLIEYAFEADRSDRKSWEKISYPYLEGRLEEAFEAFHEAGVRSNDVYWYVMSAIIATELGDDERRAEEIATARGLANGKIKKSDRSLHMAVLYCMDLLETGELPVEPDTLRERLSLLDPRTQRNYRFFLGAAMQVLGVESALSDELLDKAAATPEFDFISGNLAGYMLVRKYGQSRADPIEPIADEYGE